MAESRRVLFKTGLPKAPDGKAALEVWARNLVSSLASLLGRLDSAQVVTMDRVTDGQFLQRSGTTVVGATPSAQVSATTLLKHATGETVVTLPAAASSAAPSFVTFAKWQVD